MVDLKCKCGTCEYNNNCNCNAKEINITDSTRCKTFTKSTDPNKTEYSDEISQPLIRNQICVNCKANCLFNKKGECSANGISVMVQDNNIECSTFLPR